MSERVSKTELGKRALACNGWRWMPGMLAFDAGGNQHRVIEHDAGEAYVVTVLRDYDDAHTESSARAVDLTPVLDDPATLGCLLALVREAWGEPRTVVVPLSGGRWGVAIPNVLRQSPTHKGDTEAEALVVALEAAP